MRRDLAALLCAGVLLLAGCSSFGTGQGAREPETETPEVFTLELDDGSPSGSMDGEAPADPERDRLGWEGGYWHNETVNASNSDGLTEAERRAVINRSMARIEHIRGLEFTEPVPVETISREAFRNRTSGNYSDSLRQFDNAKFEALFLVGEEADSIAVQEATLGASVLGYYSPEESRIVLVSDSETPSISRATLAHELVHALQDQQFGLENSSGARDELQGRNGLVEGGATTVENAYIERCGVQWECLGATSAGPSGGERHFGITYMLQFPYTEGRSFVVALQERGGWAAVNDAYADLPDGAREVMFPGEYPGWEPAPVTVPDPPSHEWERVEPTAAYDRPDHARLGPSAIAAGLAHTLGDDDNESAVVSRQQVFTNSGTNPYNYAFDATRGWDGGRLQVYTNGSETGYVWRTVWTDAESAAAFADSWGAVVEHYGGTEVAEDTWVIEAQSPYADAIAIHVEGDTVTVVNAPTRAQLEEVYDA